MSISSWANSLLDEACLDREIDQQQVAQHKVEATEEGMAPIGQPKGALPVLRTPTARPAVDNRLGRREAEKEQLRLQQIAYYAQRTAMANNSIVAVVVHAHQQLDSTQEAMMSRYVGVTRTKTGNEYMQQVTLKLLALCEASVLSMVESYPKRIAEEV
jgi:hypothetical protein